MMQTTNMPSDRQHQFKIMLSDQEKAWLEELATSRGLTSSDVLRLHIRDAHAALQVRRAPGDDDFVWKDWHTEILERLNGEKDPMPREDIEEDWPQAVAAPGDMGLTLNQLSRNGYVVRLRGGYRIAPKGKALVTK